MSRTINQTKKIITSTVMMATIFISGCMQPIYTATGTILNSYGNDEMIPYLLSTDDTVMGCHAGEALAPLLLSFQRVHVHPDQIASLVWLVAGQCEITNALDEELRYIRASKSGDIINAQDAKIAEKRHYVIAASRQIKSYKAMLNYFGNPQEGKCPNFKDDNEQLTWLVGNLSGVYAVLSDAVAENQAGISKDIPAKAERAMKCLDAEKWWGLPLAVRAVLWTAIPGIIPPDEDPWAKLRSASIMGEKKGVRVAHAMEALAAANLAKNDLLREVVKRHAQSVRNTAASSTELILDKLGDDMMLAISDRMWTEATGKRTPIGGLGTFWDDKQKPGTSIDIGDIL